MISVALVGPDGVGKSTVSAALVAALAPLPAQVVYMGINREAGGRLLPSTRLVLALKERQGKRPDLVASADRWSRPEQGPRSAARALKDTARLAMWMSEEWHRLALAALARRRGAVVVFDRHVFADYYHSHVAADGAERTLPERAHGWLLAHAYPKPDLVVLLDAPGDVLFARKGEASPEWLDRRRGDYRELAAVVDHFVVVDADRPVSEVVRDVATAIHSCCAGTSR